MKKYTIITAFMVLILSLVSCKENTNMDKRAYNKLSPEEERVIVHKGTEAPFLSLIHI